MVMTRGIPFRTRRGRGLGCDRRGKRDFFLMNKPKIFFKKNAPRRGSERLIVN
jgi:hypothetical protein